MVEWPASRTLRTLTRCSAIIACWLGGASCADEAVELPAGDGQATVAPSRLDFGEVPVGSRLTLDLQITPAPGDEATIDGLNPPFTASVVTRDGNALTVRVTFVPTRAGPVQGLLAITLRDSLDLEVPLTGQGIDALIVTPATLSFGNVSLGTTRALGVSVTNPSAQPRDVEVELGSGVALCGRPSTFCLAPLTRPLTPASRMTLAAGETVSFEARYTPPQLGEHHRGVVRFSGCPTCPTVILQLDGLPVDQGLACAPEQLDFGRVAVGRCGRASVRCTNSLDTPVVVVAAMITPSTSAEMAVQLAGETVQGGETLEIPVRFCPVDLGPETARLVISTNDASTPDIHVGLRGVGGATRLVVTPSELDFGAVAADVPARRTVRVHNQSEEAVVLAELSLGSGAFTATTDSRVLLPGATRLVTVQVRHPTPERLVDVLRIRAEADDEPEIAVTVQAEVIAAPLCTYVVAATSLDFGELPRGRALRRGVEIHNLGNAECLITGAEVSSTGTPPDFSHVPTSAGAGTRIAPGEVAILAVDFAPRGLGAATGQLELSLSSRAAPYLSLPLAGSADDVSVLPAPRELALGVVPLGCGPVTRTVRLYNTAASSRTVSAVTTLPPFTAAAARPLPTLLPPGGSLDFEVRFQPGDARSHATALALRSTDASGTPVSWFVALSAAVDSPGRHVDRFEQSAARQVDVLMVLDDTSGMEPYHQAMARETGPFLGAAAGTVDYQIGVTTTGLDWGSQARLLPLQGSAAERIITSGSTPDPTRALAARILSVGAMNSATPTAFEVMVRALSSPLAFGHNAGFSRPEAELAVLLLSDAFELSTGALDYFADDFRDIKSPRRRDQAAVSAIVGAPPGCTGPLGTADSGERQVALAASTGGDAHSICSSDWAGTMAQLGARVFGPRSRFSLSSTPIPGSITVRVDGAAVPSRAWHFDAAATAVVFEPSALPGPGAQVDVEYDLACPL